jgi:hypothetical protein
MYTFLYACLQLKTICAAVSWEEHIPNLQFLKCRLDLLLGNVSIIYMNLEEEKT